MTQQGDLEIADVARAERSSLVPILEESFEGLYLRHSKRTLGDIEVVKAARIKGENVGILMLKMVAGDAGYVYYVAVLRRFRKRGVGGRLLDDAISYFAERGAKEVYASIEEENVESDALFSSRGFEKVGYSQVAEKYGRVKALLMYRDMMVVPGEVLLWRSLTPAAPRGATTGRSQGTLD